MKSTQSPYLDDEINTGKIFTLMQLRKLGEHPLFHNNVGIYKHILFTLENILKRNKIITHKWEALGEDDKKWYITNEGKLDTSFLNHKPYFGNDKSAIYPFDVTQYNESLIITYADYKESNEFRLFFALKIAFTDVAKMDSFLDYQLKKNFKGAKKAYSDFLDETLLAHKHFIEETGKIDKVNRYIQDILLNKKKNSSDIETALNPIKIPEGLEFKTPVKDYSPKELRGLYDVKEKLFRSLVDDHVQEVGKLGKSRRYTAKQVYIIFYFLGDPSIRKEK